RAFTRQREPHVRAASGVAARGDRAAVGLDELLRDREAKSRAARLRGLVEPVEDPPERLRRDARTSVGHAERDPALVVRRRFELYPAAARRVAAGGRRADSEGRPRWAGAAL